MTIDKYDLLAEYQALINRPDITEEEVHQFIVRYPVAAPLWWPIQNQVYTKLPLGNQHIVDFAFPREDSIGLRWHLIEIEKPQDRRLTKAGDQTSQLSHGLRQLLDWKTWFQENRDYVLRYLPHGEVANRIGMAEPQLILVIGRRDDVEDNNRALLRQLVAGGVDIMSFDRLAQGIQSPGCDDSMPLQMCRFVSGRTEVINELNIEVTYSIPDNGT